MTPKVEIKLWLTGVFMLVALIALGVGVMGDSAFALPEHQGAGTADRVNAIQAAWTEEGYFGLHVFGMFADLVFIVVYSLGAWQAGMGLRAQKSGFVRIVGLYVMASAVLFFACDMTETSLQLIQMITFEGVDWMAATAAFAQPIKNISWIASFLGVVVGLIGVRLTGRGV